MVLRIRNPRRTALPARPMRGPPRTSNTQTPHGPPATAGDSGDGRRYHALDNLRAWMMLLLIPFHAALPFLTVPALMRFNDPDAGVAFDATALFLLSFRRPVFFVMGGFFAAMLLERRGVRGMLANRAQRILAPLVLGWIVLSPATHAAYDFALGAANGGSTRAGMAKLGEGDWIDWERPFHLWFLAALLIFYAAALGLRWALPRILGRHLWAYEEGTRRFFASRWRALLLAAALAPLLVPSEFLPYNRGNPFLALSLALMFGLGGRLYVHRDLLGELRRGAWTHVVLGFALLPLATWTRWNVVHDSPHELAWGLVSGLSGTLMSALLVFGTIGVFLRHADGHSRALRYLSDSSYWVYLAHMPVVVVLGGLFATTELPAVLKFTLTVAGTTVFTLATYSLFVRHTAIGRLLNGPRRRGGSVAGKSI